MQCSTCRFPKASFSKNHHFSFKTTRIHYFKKNSINPEASCCWSARRRREGAQTNCRAAKDRQVQRQRRELERGKLRRARPPLIDAPESSARGNNIGIHPPRRRRTGLCRLGLYSFEQQNFACSSIYWPVRHGEFLITLVAGREGGCGYRFMALEQKKKKFTYFFLRSSFFNQQWQ